MHPVINVLFLVAVIFISTTNGDAPTPCEVKELTKCSDEFVSTAKALGPSASATKDFCEPYNQLGNCLSSKTCNGETSFYFDLTILQHLTLDKRLGRCPNHEFTDLRKIVKAHFDQTMLDDLTKLESAKIGECAKVINAMCSEILALDLKNAQKKCVDVKAYYECYLNPGVEPACTAEIYQDYIASFSRKWRSSLAVASFKYPGMLPAICMTK